MLKGIWFDTAEFKISGKEAKLSLFGCFYPHIRV